MSRDIAEYVRRLEAGLRVDCAPVAQGSLTRVVGMTLEAVGIDAALGQRCLIVAPGARSVQAEVVGFAADRVFLMPTERVAGLRPGLRVRPLVQQSTVPAGDGLLGRVLGGSGQPLDGRGALHGVHFVELDAHPINPLHRAPIRKVLDVGVRSLNGLLTVGRGQRLGIFAGSGVGKSMLLGMMTRFTEADVTVVALVGERGREAREFVEDILGADGMRRAVVVVSPADDAPLMRLRSARLATRIAEDFRDRGSNVLLLMDSLTRFAHAQREVGLAVGEPPATRGYPPSVFARIPELVERAGNGEIGHGSITAFYTVLTEGDDMQDPVADAARAILDGHVVLSRTLAEEGLYPAVDIEASISRAMPAIADPEHRRNAQEFKKLYARFQQNRDLISVGAYAPGSDEDTDRAIARMPVMRAYLQQGLDERVDHPSSVRQLAMQFDNAPAEVRPAATAARRQLRSALPVAPVETP
ncbi:MAG: flagellar protein export ATPase FliI [Gammaproteobacteria bacterium]|nr:flagellar protein export ATPase FliI [Gammaproteobacteria bacterium]MBP6052150.1 flagellar protein export ATPase FliI [Pseudomonadales bacterium]MBK6582211.1 flagellar protein export ATPase FliI [Gammaproteobacteria bacterium]MBK7521515.1 flagellar protein export ATPase FliI [Gammaproteobacteria bacterium]MBK7729290.1 flagellar protein export ATPase FliI [Gammaproteobacteria bacterium]